MVNDVYTGSETSADIIITKVVISALAMAVVKMAIVKAVSISPSNSAIPSAIYAITEHCGSFAPAAVSLSHTTNPALIGALAISSIMAMVAH